MPTTGVEGLSATLVHPLALVVRHDGVEQPLLRTRVVQVMVDYLITQERPCDRPAFKTVDRLAHRVREALDIGLVRIALERRPELELLLDPMQAGGEERRESEVRVRVGSGNARLGTQRRAVP